MKMNEYEALMAQAADRMRELQDENKRLRQHVKDLEKALTAEQLANLKD